MGQILHHLWGFACCQPHLRPVINLRRHRGVHFIHSPPKLPISAEGRGDPDKIHLSSWLHGELPVMMMMMMPSRWVMARGGWEVPLRC